MKNLVIYCLLIFFNLNCYSQSKEECFSNLSIFAEYAKVKNYDAAYEPWLKVRGECPDINSAIYVYGERILKFYIKNSQGNDKDQYEEDLLELYDEWLKYFSKSKSGKQQTGKILAIKAQSMLDYKLADPKEIYDVYDEAFKIDPGSFTTPKGLYNYFKIYFNLYKAGNASVSLESLFEKYEELTEKFELEMDVYTSK
ncbi:MAG: hypothetical protein HOK38_03380, partial [Flavobacteriaceae bacterium]|nr:hypothetical protein [Flavobacteriaceae bacterium]